MFKFKVGDYVRISKNKGLFEKGYKDNWSEEIYVISKVKQTNGVCYYYLKDLSHKDLPGIYYYHQLNLVSRNVDSSERQSS